jgi:hypothetical protein
MGQIRNVTLIVIATAIMAIATSILVYFVDHLALNVRESHSGLLLELQQKYIHSHKPQSIDFKYPGEKNKKYKEIYSLQ